MPQLDDLLADADPARAARHPRAEALVHDIAADARKSALGAPSARRLTGIRLVVPFAIGGAVLLTGAAAVATTPLWFRGDAGQPVAGDVAIPVEYQTEEGSQVSCTYAMQFGAETANGAYPLPANFDALIEELNASKNWAHFGEEVLALLGEGSKLPPGTHWTSGGEVVDNGAWLAAADNVFRSRLPEDLRNLPHSTTSDCMSEPQ